MFAAPLIAPRNDRGEISGLELRTVRSDALPRLSKLDPGVRPNELTADILAFERSLHLVPADDHGTTVTVDANFHFGWRQAVHHVAPFDAVGEVLFLASDLPEMVDVRVIIGQSFLQKRLDRLPVVESA